VGQFQGVISGGESASVYRLRGTDGRSKSQGPALIQTQRSSHRSGVGTTARRTRATIIKLHGSGRKFFSLGSDHEYKFYRPACGISVLNRGDRRRAQTFDYVYSERCACGKEAVVAVIRNRE